MQSMTGFGSGSASGAEGTFEVSVQSVNSRFLDLNVRDNGVPSSVVEHLRQMLKERLARGKVTLTLHFIPSRDNERIHVSTNEKLLEEYIRTFREVRKMPGVSHEKPTISDLLSMPEPWLTVEVPAVSEEQMTKLAEEAMNTALGQLIDMRRREGENLAADLLRRIDLLEEKRNFIIARKDDVVTAYEKKLRERMTTLLSDMGAVPDEAKIMTEVAALSEKTDITEELVRFGSHLSQFRSILSEDGPVGRKLNFLLQEINREVNTTASKADNLEVIDCVIIIKTELEKIREQVQNLE
jgi:uncharacterized protein (TIGR00255 family)